MPLPLEKMRQIQSVEFDDWLVLVHPGSEGFFLLNPMARHIWEALLTGSDISEIAESLSAAFEREYREIEGDIERVIREWEVTLFHPQHIAPSEVPDSIAALSDKGPVSVFDFRLYGHCFRLMISDPELEMEIQQRFGPFQVEGHDFTPDFTYELALSEVGYTITNAEGLRVASDRSPGAARVDLINRLISICFPGRRWLACIHAAAMAEGDRCFLLCAPSGGGKSTLAAAMMSSGYTLITDDLAYLDSQQLKVSGLPLALMLRAGSWKALNAVYPKLTNLPVYLREGEPVRFLSSRFNKEAVSAQPAAIFFLDYQANASAELRAMSNADALVKIDQTSSWVDHSADRLKIFLRWLQTVSKYQLTYSNTADAVELASAALKA